MHARAAAHDRQTRKRERMGKKRHAMMHDEGARMTPEMEKREKRGCRLRRGKELGSVCVLPEPVTPAAGALTLTADPSFLRNPCLP